MPTPLIKKYAEKTGKTIEAVEKLWDESKKVADGRGLDRTNKLYWAFVTSTLQRKLGLREALTFKEYAQLELELPPEEGASQVVALAPSPEAVPAAPPEVAPDINATSIPSCDFTPASLVNGLFGARDVAHMLHLSTRSFAQHVALEELYDGLTSFADRLAEVLQGKYGPLRFSPGHFAVDETTHPAPFVGAVASWITAVGRSCLSPEDTFALNIVDEVEALVYRTKYKLEQLQ